MAALAKLFNIYNEDFLNSYFESWKDAEANRLRENSAAVVIQRAWRHYVNHCNRIFQSAKAIIITKTWRGYRARKLFEEKLREKHETENMNFFRGHAIKIQKVWRGFYCRKYVFSYYDRRDYIRSLEEKYDTVRSALSQFNELQSSFDQEQLTLTKQAIYEKASERYHHLLGTSRIPGILPKKESISPQSNSHHHHHNRHKKSHNNEGHKARTTSSADNHNRNQAHGAQHPAQERSLFHLTTLPPLGSSTIKKITDIPEEAIRNSEEVRRFIIKDLKAFPNKFLEIMKNKGKTQRLSDEARKKYAKGPFQPRYKVESLKNKMPKTTLRMDEEYNKIDLEREENRIKKAMNISEKVFVISKNLPRFYQPSIFQGSGYEGEGQGNLFRDPKALSVKRLIKEDFKTVVPPIPLFDEYQS